MEEMTRSEAIDFLMTGTRTGKLATVRADGRPHVAPVWFVVEGDDTIVFSTGEKSVKGRNLAREGRAIMVVDLEEAPYAYVMVEGAATLSDDLEDSLRVATRIGGRYMGSERAEEFGRRNAVPGELVVRLQMDRVIARRDIAGYD